MNIGRKKITTILTTRSLILKHFETSLLESNPDLCVALLCHLWPQGFPKDSVLSRVDWCGASEQCNQMRKDVG